MKMPWLLLILLGSSFAIDIDFFYGQGCPHCAATSETLASYVDEYNLSITTHEVYYNPGERQLLFSYYDMFGYDPAQGGVPTTIVGKAMVIGELKDEQWEMLFKDCQDGCPPVILSVNNFNLSDGGESAHNEAQSDPIEEKDEAAALTIPVLIGAAIVDSINPCTIAVMVLLIGAVMMSKGKQSALVSGMVFTGVIFIMYMLYGLGIMKAIAAFELTNIFYLLVTIGAFALSIMEFNAYLNYKPGFMAVEMPMWLRPHAKKATSGATSPFGVAIAAVLCSLFLLPCSSGPYLLVLGMLAKAATIQTIGYLLLYNLFFVLPMLIITLAIHAGKTSAEQVGEMKEKYIRQIHLFSGVVLFLLFLMMLGQLLGYL
jgi:thiol-disulfide isomerase/thioredoxin